MARYIDADALEQKLELYIKSWGRDCNSNAERMVKAYENALYWVKVMPTADVVPKSEEGAECPTCHGTGRIGTTDWLTKNISKKQLAEEKAKAIAEHEQHIKTEVAMNIFSDIENLFGVATETTVLAEVFETPNYKRFKKKYTGESCKD